MPSLDYLGYPVVVNATPSPGNCYYSVFAIIATSPTVLPCERLWPVSKDSEPASYAILPTSPARMLLSARVPG
jgi:hypothetical protein